MSPELVRQLPPHEDGVCSCCQFFEESELVLHFRPTHDDHKRSCRILPHPQSCFHLFLEPQSRIARQVLRDPDDAGAPPMCFPKGLVHIDITQVGQFARECRVVCILAHPQSHILEHYHPLRAIVQSRSRADEFYFLSEQSARICRDRCQTPLLLRLPQMREEYYLRCAMSDEPLYRRQRPHNAGIVHDF